MNDVRRLLPPGISRTTRSRRLVVRLDPTAPGARELVPPADPSRTRLGNHHEPASRLTTAAAVLAWSLPG
jgi:hypothetical protein